MSHELFQIGAGHAAFIDDKTGNRDLHMQPNSRINGTLMFSLSRGSAVPTGLGGDTNVTLPGGAVPVAIYYYGAANDSVTGSTLTIGLDTTSNYFMAATNVANATTGLGQQTPSGSNLFTQLALLPAGGVHSVTGLYSAGGATSASGGPWYFAIDYYVPIPA